MPPILLSQAQTQYDRPAEGLARGRFPAPAPVILALGAVVVVAALVYLGVKLRRVIKGKGR